MEEILKEALGTVTLKPTGCHGGGCINEGEAYFIDSGTVFVKQNRKAKAREMFDGEYESLKAIAATNSVRAPDPIVVLDNPDGGAVIVLEYLDMKVLRKYSAQLGEQLAKMHLHNHTLSNNKQKGYVGKEETLFPVENFGFHVTTCCGYIPQDNTWRSDWPLSHLASLTRYTDRVHFLVIIFWYPHLHSVDGLMLGHLNHVADERDWKRVPV